MQTLILSCNTGAGHNSCAQAVQEAYHSRGEICNIIDSLQFISEKASTFISNWHTRIYRHAPRLFDAGYQRAESHEDIRPFAGLCSECTRARTGKEASTKAD